MSNRLRCVAFLACLLTHVTLADEQQRRELAKTLVERITAGKFEEAVEPFDATMKKGLSPARLKESWAALAALCGEFQSIGDSRTETAGKYELVFVAIHFARAKFEAKVVFDAESRVAGLFFVSPGKYESPAYVKADSFDEEEVSVGKGLLPLPGTLAIPKGEGPFPAVVLVHGSGPNDRDESIGPTKPFRDLAHGLASQGIAVLRFEKRTKQYSTAMALLSATLTVKEETVDDAVAAVDTIAAHPKVDGKRVFVLGHSLGGYVLPRIANGNDKAAGYISLAGSTRPMEVLILEQSRYIAALDSNHAEEKKQQIEALEKQVAKATSPDLSVLTLASELPLGIPARYWLDLRNYKPAEEARDLRKPLLVLQGERDYQVTMEDFALWKKSLGERADVKFISYPKLNHLFIAGEGKSTPAEYFQAGNVADEVVDDIAAWIKAVK